MGFGSEEQLRAARRHITVKQLTEFGMLPEFLGRMPVIVDLDRLGESDLVRILTEPPDAITREYKELLAMDEIELRFTPGALESVARFSVDKGLGARGLRTILEHVMAEILFEAPENKRRTMTIDAPLVKQRLSDFHLMSV